MPGAQLLLVALVALWTPDTPQDVAAGIRDAAALAAGGDQAGAASAYRDLLAKAPGATSDRAGVLDALGAVEIALGQYAPARQHADEAASIYGAMGDAKRRSGALNRSGRARTYAGDYRSAVGVFEQAIQLSAAAGDAEANAEQVSNLGSVFYFLGRYSDAASAYERALATTEAHRAAPWAGRRRRLVIVNLATLDQRLGRDGEALAQYRHLDADGVSLRPREQAQMLANMGVLYRRLGDPVKALETYDNALRLFAKDPMLDGELGVIKNRGIVMALDQGNLEGARESFSLSFERARAAGNKREMLQASLYRGETLRRLGRPDAARADFTDSLTAARDLHAPEETWKALDGLGRLALARGDHADAIRDFDEALGVIEALRENIRVPLLRSDYFSDKREVYDHQLAARLGSAPPAAIFALLERSHSRAWRERLGLSASVDVAAVQRHLAPGTVLLDYWHSLAGSAVVAVSRDAVTVSALDVPDERIRALHDLIAPGPSSTWQPIAADLSARLLPAAVIGGATHLVIVGDGALALVPFELLPVNGRPLIERATVTYMPTAALLLRDAPGVPSLAPPWRVTLAAFGDPIVPAARLDDPQAIRARLAASADEVRDIASELGGTSRIHTGADNLKAYLSTPGGTAPILHLATHAIADTDALEQSRILFSSVDARSADYLFLREAYELPLTHVELAVLSACETERGRFVRGEGVQSFSRAFLAAGARSTVTTLWRVADAPTADFMRIFYYHLERGESRAEALQRTKIRFLQSGGPSADPHVWAAFVLSGDGTRPIPRAVRWRSVFAVAGVTALLVILLASFVRRRR